MKKVYISFFCSLFVLAAMVMSAQGDEKILICHIPPDNPANPQTISVGATSVPSHLAHGDYLGECTACKSDGVPCDTPSLSSSECCNRICSEEGICASDCAPLQDSGEGGQCTFDKPCCPDSGVCILGSCFIEEFSGCGLLGDACDEPDNPCCFDYSCSNDGVCVNTP